LERDVANLARRWFIVAPNTTAPEIERETYEVGIANLDGFLLIYLPERGLSVDSVPAPMTRFGAMTSLSTYLGTAADAALAQDGRPRVSFAGRGVWTGIGINLHN